MNDGRPLKVSFLPVAEQYGHAAEVIHKQKGIKQNIWQSLLIYLCVIYVFLVPVILAYFGQYIAAAISFAIILAFLIAYLHFGKTSAYVDFYRQSFEKDPEEMEVELTDEGIRTSCNDCSSLFRWSSIVETQKSGDAVYFLTKDCGIAVPTAAFDSSDEAAAFIEFAGAKTGHQ